MSSSVLAVLAALATTAPVPGSAPSPKPKVIVIGIDAASLNILGPYASSGVTPVLGRLMAEGATGELASYWPLRTPQVWTSIATGKLPGQHGLWDHVSSSYYNPPPFRTKEPTPLTSRERRSKALWQLVGAAGLRSLVVGWVSSWPAEELPQAVIAAPSMPGQASRRISIKGSFWRDEPTEAGPRSLWPKMRELVTEPEDLGREKLARFADLPAAGDPVLELPYLRAYTRAIPWSLARAESVEALTLGLLGEARPDVVLTYFQCPDSLGHRFWIFGKGEAATRERLRGHGLRADLAPELTRRFGHVVEACYRDFDERVGRILAAARGPETLVLVVSDHGFGDAAEPHTLREEPYGGTHLDHGVIVAAGPGIMAGRRIEGASVLDVTPSILYALGLPVGGDMRGKVIPALFADGALARRPPAVVPTYESAPQTDVPYAEGWPPRKHPAPSIDE